MFKTLTERTHGAGNGFDSRNRVVNVNEIESIEEITDSRIGASSKVTMRSGDTFFCAQEPREIAGI